MPKPASTRQISCGSIVSATRAAPTSLERASTVVSGILPRFESSWMINALLIRQNPGEVSTIVVGLKPPLSIADAITSGLKLEPGSKMSVIARFL